MGLYSPSPSLSFSRNILIAFSGLPLSVILGLYKIGSFPTFSFALFLPGVWSRLSLYGVHFTGFHLFPKVLMSLLAIARHPFPHGCSIPCLWFSMYSCASPTVFTLCSFLRHFDAFSFIK